MTFRIADVTRMMTCDVLYGLVDDDVVELDDARRHVDLLRHLEPPSASTISASASTAMGPG